MTGSIDKRLGDLEAAAEVEALYNWKMFWNSFTEAELKLIATKKADPELQARAEESSKLVIPECFKTELNEIIQGLEKGVSPEEMYERETEILQ